MKVRVSNNFKRQTGRGAEDRALLWGAAMAQSYWWGRSIDTVETKVRSI